MFGQFSLSPWHIRKEQSTDVVQTLLDKPLNFLKSRVEARSVAKLALVAAGTEQGKADRSRVVGSLMELLAAVDRPTAFYVRLLNERVQEFPAVEQFFREVVDPVIANMGYRRIEMGTDATEHGFVNVEILDRLHFSELAIFDVTGLRPNCFIELGYALARPIPTIVTAAIGTVLPFDQNAIPCHFWDAGTGKDLSIRKLLEFIEKNLGRPPLIF